MGDSSGASTFDSSGETLVGHSPSMLAATITGTLAGNSWVEGVIEVSSATPNETFLPLHPSPTNPPVGGSSKGQ